MINEIRQIIYGKTAIPESWIFAGGNKEKEIPIVLSFYLVLVENRKILIDAGSDTMDGFTLTDFTPPVKALQRQGFAPEDITDVIITHAHHDHIGCVGFYKNARVFIQKDEYTGGKNYINPAADIILFENEAKPYDGIKVHKIGGHTKGSCVVEFEKGGETFVVAGDECYSDYNIKNKIPTATSQNPVESENFIKRYTNPKYNVLLIH